MFDRLLFDRNKFDREVNDSWEGRLSGIGDLVCAPIIITQLRNFILSAYGDLIISVGITLEFGIILSGEGRLASYPDEDKIDIYLNQELTPTLTSYGKIDILNIGDMEVSVLDLRNISLLPGETITIDTDSMVVLFGLVHDVSSLTSDSEFFELDKGTNELRFEIGYEVAPNPMPADELDTIFIWQNRWL